MTDEARAARNEYSREYRKTHSDEVRASYSQWRDKNREHLREYQKQWRHENPDKVRRYNTTYWERKAAKAKGEQGA